MVTQDVWLLGEGVILPLTAQSALVFINSLQSVLGIRAPFIGQPRHWSTPLRSRLARDSLIKPSEQLRVHVSNIPESSSTHITYARVWNDYNNGSICKTILN